jgi:formylglycine-generating enzyme required for sulfatase activity
VLLLVQAGEFPMGPPSQVKRVTLKPFYMDRLEVTNAQYAKFLADVAKQGDAAWRHPDQPASKKSHVPSLWSSPDLGEAKANCPVVGVDWFDAYAYAKWADKRLPTEAEWEKAARGADGRAFPWGAAPPEERFRFRANFFGSSLGADGFRFTAPVGSFPLGASPCGCLDMAGNAVEWCADWFGPPPAEARLLDPAGPQAGTERVTKGGGWNLGAESLHCYNRWPLAPDRRIANVGFRCAKDAPLEATAPAAK